MSDTLLADRVKTNLVRLKLRRIGDILERTMSEEKTSFALLDELLEEEVACGERRRVETSLKISGLPFVKGIDDFSPGWTVRR